MRREIEAAWDAVIVDLLRRAKLVRPDALAAEINAATGPVGVEVTVYVVDHEQERLWALPERGKPTPPPLALDGSAAGRAFTLIRTEEPTPGETPYRLWVAMIDGSERLGVAEVVARRPPDDPEAFRSRCEVMIGLVGHLLTAKLPYGDALHVARRTRPMSPAGELLLHLLPPLTFSCHGLVVSAVLEPCYDVGGDAYDYAVDGSLARVMVLDAMGRGLSAGLTSAAAIASIRAARRNGGQLPVLARAADDALLEQFPDVRFVTGVLAELEMTSGVLHYLNAGHPPPLLIRDGRVVKSLTGGRRRPLGLEDDSTEVGTETLQPGDWVLIYTDGVTEAYDPSGERFGVSRLTEVIERSMADRLPVPETLRRLSHTVLEHQGGRPTDDATILLVVWSEVAAERTQL